MTTKKFLRSYIVIAPILVALFLTGCSKKDTTETKVPTLTTNAVGNITSQSADCGGKILSGGNSSVTERGVCWSTSKNPTTLSSHSTASGSSSSFVVSMTGLAGNMVYYARAYAVNNDGTGYGNQVAFTTKDPFATLTGTVKFTTGSSGDLSNSKVSLYTSLTEWQNNIPVKSGTVTGSGSSVTYTMTDVLPGTYYLDVWKDIDNNSNWSVGDYVGWYGTGNVSSITLIPFQVIEGQTVNKDVTMFILQ